MEMVVLTGSLDLSFGGGSVEELLGELKAETEAALASGLAQLLDVPQAWIKVTLMSAQDNAASSGRRLRQSSLATAATSGANRRLQAQQLVAIYTITIPADAKGGNAAETTGSVQDTFLNVGAEQLTSTLQGSLSSTLGSQFQVQVDAFSVPSTGPVSTTTAGLDEPSSCAAPAMALTTAHAVVLAALMTKVLAW
jgi:hypothetical protein